MRKYTEEEIKVITETPITMDCFEMDDLSCPILSNDIDKCSDVIQFVWKPLIFSLERLRRLYNETKDKRYWKELIRLLPNSYKVVKL